MAGTLNSFLNRTLHSFIFGSTIISLCTAAMVLETYLLLGLPLKVDGLVLFVFFATLFLYNFHRLMGVRRIKPEDHGLITGWASKNVFMLLFLTVVGAGGVAIFVFQISLQVIIILVPLGAVSMLYELPLVRYNKQFNQVRNVWVFKIILITCVWAVTTALLPAINARISLMNYNVWLVLFERVIFIFTLALCFDARDIAFDVKDQLKTIPVLFGMKTVNTLYYACCISFIVVSALHYAVLNRLWGIAAAMIASMMVTYYTVKRTQPRRSDYYYLFFVDGMMIIQFAFVLLGHWVK